MKTSCRFCEFRVNDEKGNQVACELGKHDEYLKQGIMVGQHDLESLKEFTGTEIEKPEDQTTFSVVDIFCLYRRPLGWKEAVLKKEENAGKAWAEIARSELDLAVTAVVYVAPEQTLEHVKATVEAFNAMTRKPAAIVFMNNAKIAPIKFISEVNRMTKIPWRMEFFLEEQRKTAEETRMRCIDIGLTKVESPHYISINAGDALPPEYIFELEDAIIDKNESFCCKHESETERFFCLTKLHRMLNGNRAEDGHNHQELYSKIVKMAEEQKCPQIIKK